LNVTNDTYSRDTLYAAGRLDVAGKSKITLLVRVPLTRGEYRPKMDAAVVDQTGATTAMQLTSAILGATHLALIPADYDWEDLTFEFALNGQTQLWIVVSGNDSGGRVGTTVNFTVVSITTE
jgi:hypothetical protein